MTKPWHKIKEKAAGTKRLLLTFYIYKFLGKTPVFLIASIVSFFAYIFSKEERQNIKKYLNIVSKQLSTPKYRYSFLKGYKIFQNYAFSLVDKMLVFIGDFKPDNLIFDKKCDKEKIMDYIKKKKGIFFITSHLGNVEIIRSLLFSDKYEVTPNVNVFLEDSQCKIFNGFIKKISKKTNKVEIFAIEDIDIGTSIVIQEKLLSGEILFMAGDRVSKRNQEQIYEIDFLGNKINLPLGVFKFAYIMESPIFFITAIKEKGGYKIYAKEFIKNSNNKKEFLNSIKNEYGAFLEEYTLKHPLQFYNFFDVFKTID